MHVYVCMYLCIYKGDRMLQKNKPSGFYGAMLAQSAVMRQ